MKRTPVLEPCEVPVVGRWYRVPHVYHVWGGKVRWWPVRGPRHRDDDHFRFPHLHYHLDARFCSDTALGWREGEESAFFVALRWPLARPRLARGSKAATEYDLVPPAETTLRAAKCYRVGPMVLTREVNDSITMRRFRKHYAGALCPSREGLHLCPHRAVVLDGEPVVDGVVTCPLHGLRIRTGPRAWRVEL